MGSLHWVESEMDIKGHTPSLNAEIQNLAFVVDGAPEPVALPPDDDHHLIEVPMIAGPGAGAA